MSQGEPGITIEEVDGNLLKHFLCLPLSESRWIFRGQSDSDHSLQPMIERVRGRYDIADAEQLSLQQFKRRAHQYLRHLPEEDDTLEWLALMRHFGGPTRLLDWTTSPYVATFFALAEAHPEKASAVWALDAQCLKRSVVEILTREGESVGTETHFGAPAIFNRLILPGPNQPRPTVSFVVPLGPRRMNERLTLQRGLFLASNAPEDFFAILKSTLGERLLGLEPETARPGLVKYVIKPEARAYLLRELERMNITYATLFPGLEGFARSLSTHLSMLGSVDDFIAQDEDHLY